ncbi:Bacteriophage Lambda NinG protein [compost metagenome]
MEYHAGHFRTTKAASQLRFNEDNCHLQCSACNVHHSGAIGPYRINLIAKIGLERVLALESDNTAHRHAREELDGIRAHYRAKLREMKKHQEAA